MLLEVALADSWGLTSSSSVATYFDLVMVEHIALPTCLVVDIVGARQCQTLESPFLHLCREPPNIRSKQPTSQ